MILKYVTKWEWLIILICVITTAANVYLELKIPDYMEDITTIISTRGEVIEVLEEGLMMLVCALGGLLTTVICATMAAYVATSLAKRLRELQFERVQSFSMQEMDRFSIPSLVTRSTNDISQIQLVFAMGIQVMIKAPIMALWALEKILVKNIEWTIATGLAVLILLVIIGSIIAYVRPRFMRIQGLTDNVNRITRENITGIRVIRAYNAESFQSDRFESANSELTNTYLSTQRAMAFLMPGMTLVLYLLSLSIYWIGAILIDSTEQIVFFSDMVVFSSYALQIIMSFLMLVLILMILPRASVAAKRVQEVINTEPSIVSGDVKEERASSDKIVFKNVSFKYPESSEDVLVDLNLKISKGETFAIIGPTGSGKSSLINLIPRLYDATAGSIEVDGVDVRQYDLDTLRKKIGYVSQKSFIFSGTVQNNINYGLGSETRTDEDVERAAIIAQAHEFIKKMDDGYASDIAQGGTNLSGGQKQRISIARAICKSPEIYIFDDTFSALDYRTDKILRSELKKQIDGTTKIIVAQRVSTIMDADRILVLDGGRIVGIGKHDDLIVDCPTYRDIVDSQMNDQEAGS